MTEQLKEGLAQLGLTPPEGAVAQMARYAGLLLEQNKVMNLTAITDPAEVATLHFLDSAALLGTADFRGKSVVDVGTGAGFPGLPLRILEPTIRLTLLDALQKGILRFAQDWQKSFLQTLAIPPQTAIAPFLRLVGQPTAGETALLGDLTVEDGGVYPLAAPRKVGYYLTHANQAKQDLSAARWKIGFLKRLAPLPLPYDRLYAKMKK